MMNETPCHSPEAQESFTPGSRIFERNEYLGAWSEEGAYLGWIGDDELSPKSAVVKWDARGVRQTSFGDIRNLYR